MYQKLVFQARRWRSSGCHRLNITHVRNVAQELMTHAQTMLLSKAELRSSHTGVKQCTAKRNKAVHRHGVKRCSAKQNKAVHRHERKAVHRQSKQRGTPTWA